MGLFSSKSGQQKWVEGIEDLRDRAADEDRKAKRLERIGAAKLAAKQRDNAREDRKVADRMDRCGRHPKHGGKGYDQ